jgi:hypothetical protein
LKEFSNELASNITLTSLSVKKEDEGLGLDATGVRFLQRNVNLVRLLDGLSTPVSEVCTESRDRKERRGEKRTEERGKNRTQRRGGLRGVYSSVNIYRLSSCPLPS